MCLVQAIVFLAVNYIEHPPPTNITCLVRLSPKWSPFTVNFLPNNVLFCFIPERSSYMN